MIVIIGNPIAAPMDPGFAGSAAMTAAAAARMGARVELVGKAGDDGTGDGVLIALARSGVGHAALLRDPAHPTPVVVPRSESMVEDVVADDEPPPPARLEPVDPADRPALDRADVELALRYLPEIRVIVVVEPSAEIVTAAAEAAGYAGAHLVVLAAGEGSAVEVPPGSLVLEASGWDPDGAGASFVGEYAAAVDAGTSPADAFGRLRERLSGAPAGG